MKDMTIMATAGVGATMGDTEGHLGHTGDQATPLMSERDGTAAASGAEVTSSPVEPLVNQGRDPRATRSRRSHWSGGKDGAMADGMEDGKPTGGKVAPTPRANPARDPKDPKVANPARDPKDPRVGNPARDPRKAPRDTGFTSFMIMDMVMDMDGPTMDGAMTDGAMTDILVRLARVVREPSLARVVRETSLARLGTRRMIGMMMATMTMVGIMMAGMIIATRKTPATKVVLDGKLMGGTVICTTRQILNGFVARFLV